MEYLFQADINGSLERLDRIENGYEHSDHRSSTDIILCSLKSTLDSLDIERESALLQAPGHRTELQDPQDVCHAVLFNAWMRRKDALTSFSVSRYRRGILPNEYYQIIETLNFTSNFKTSIYTLDPEVAMSALQELLPHIETCRLWDYLPLYLRVFRSINSEELCHSAMDYLCQYLNAHILDTQSVQQLLSTLLSFYASTIQLPEYHCIGLYRVTILLHHSSRDIIKEHLRQSWKKLLKLVHDKYNTVFSSANVEMLVSDLDWTEPHQTLFVDVDDGAIMTWNNSSAASMLELWNKSLATDVSSHRRHEYAFELVCMGIWKNAVASRHTTISSDQLFTPDGSDAKQLWFSACDVLSTHLLSLTENGKVVAIHSDLYCCMESCLTTLKNLSGSWKSIMKAMTQFSDIWIRTLPDNECIVAFADLVVIAGTWTYLYQFVVNVINASPGNGHIEIVSQQQKSSLCALIRMVIKRLETNDLLELIYDTYSNRSLPNDENELSSPFKEDLFDDMATLQKCCNQFVHTEQDDGKPYGDIGEQYQVEPRLLHQLAMLAVLSPHETVWRLVNHGIENKGQHDLVVSILRQLGDLCMLRRYPGDKTLFGHMIELLLLNNHFYTGFDSLAPMLLSCWKYVRTPSTSILLDSYASITRSTDKHQIIIHIKELFDDCLLPELQQQQQLGSDSILTLTYDILDLFYILTEDTSPALEKWEQQLHQYVSHIPIILEMDVDILMRTLANIMDERYKTDNSTTTLSSRNKQGGTDTVALSRALDIGRKLTMATQHVFSLFKNTPERLADIKMKLLGFYECLDDFDWRTRLFWQEGYRYVTDNCNLPLYVPSAIVPFLQPIDTNVSGQDMEYLWKPDEDNDMALDSDQEWSLVLNGCRSSTVFTDELFKYDIARTHPIGLIWGHPYAHEVCSLFHEHLARNLHPAFSTAAHYEYRLLLIYYLGRLYDAHEDDDVMHLYQGYDSPAAPLVKFLTAEHCRIYYMALHSILLLKIPDAIKKTGDDDGTAIEHGELYYVSGIVQTIQMMANWQQLGMEESITNTTQSLARKKILAMALDPANTIESSNTPCSVEESTTNTSHLETTTEEISSQSTNTTDTPSKPYQQDIIDCYYPWTNDQRRSGRALYLLMIQAICQVSKSMSSPSRRKSYDILRVLLLQMVEGLEDRQERNIFMDQYTSKQTKAFINKWKKNKKDRRIRVHLRPFLAPYEMDLIKICYQTLPYTDDQAILQNLLKRSSSSTSPTLYIYNSQ